jgi:fumarate reductase flavoprotein subunit
VKKLAGILLVCLCILGGCITSKANAGSATGLYKPGEYIGTAKGLDGEIKLKVRVDENKILSVVVVENNETKGIGSNAIKEMPEMFVKANSADIDGVSGCTVSSNALKEAVQKALNQAKLVSAPASSIMKDGTYTASVKSYAEINGLATGNGKMTMEVSVADNKIATIKVLDYTDTSVIGGMAYPQLVQRVLETQSLDVDTVSGATVSSGAFMSALSSCVEQAGGNVLALKGRKVERRAAEKAEYSTDIVVVGAGIAGLSASIEAARLGAKVILLEKNEVLSSSTTRSLGFVVGANTELQKASGIDDTTDALYKDIYACYKDEKELDTTLLKKLCVDSTDLNKFLLSCGVKFDHVKNVSPKEPRATKRTHVTTGGGAELSSVLLAEAKKQGVTVMMGTPATGILKSGDSVVGCKASNKYGDDITIKASAVINCAGSYSNNPEMLKKLNPRLTNAEYVCGSGNGDSYTLTKSAGGAIVDIPYPQMMYYFYSPSWSKVPAVLPASPDNGVPDILLIDGAGKRVCSEDDFCFEYVKKVWEGGYDEGYCVVGQAFADKYPDTIEVGLSTKESVGGKPFGYKANSIADLAKDVGIDPAALTATVDRYNQLCDKGQDDDFKKESKFMVKITAPYYILRLPQIATDGYTGARINKNAQVVDVKGNPIPGFYAAGSAACGQITGVDYFGCGSSLLTGGVFGRAAAQDAVSKLKK